MNYAALADLSLARENVDAALAYSVHAWAIRLKLGTATIEDVPALAGLRQRLGRDHFRAAVVASGLDGDSASSLIDLLDQREKATVVDPA